MNINPNFELTKADRRQPRLFQRDRCARTQNGETAMAVQDRFCRGEERASSGDVSGIELIGLLADVVHFGSGPRHQMTFAPWAGYCSLLCVDRQLSVEGTLVSGSCFATAYVGFQVRVFA